MTSVPEIAGGETAAPARRPRPLWANVLLHGGAIGLAFLSVLEAGLALIGVSDLWWILATGRHLTEHREIPRVDVFSHTFAGQSWINLEWLSHVLFYNVYQHLGENWIVYLRIGTVFLIFGVVLALCWMRSRSWLISLLSVAFGAWVCRPFLDARPQLFTFLFSILILLILEHLRRRDRNVLFWIPLIFLLWTQLHGGFVFGLCLLLGNLLAESGKRLCHLPSEPLSWKAIRLLAVVTLLSAAAVLLNPWTWGAYAHLLDIFGGPNDVFIELTREWLAPRPFTPQPFNPMQFWIYLPLLALVTLPIAWARWRSFDLTDVSLALVVAVFFALQHRRFIPLFTILSIPLLCYAVKFWVDRWLHGRQQGASWKPRAPLPAAAANRLLKGTAVAAIASWCLLVAVVPYRLLHLHRDYASFLHSKDQRDTLFRANIHFPFYPERAVAFLRDVQVRGRMFNLYGWGGYLHYFLPEQQTFIDGRGWMSHGAGLFNNYLRVHYCHDDWKSILDFHDVTYALIHRRDNAALLRAMDADRQWTWIFADGDSAVLVRQSLANRALLARFRARELPLPDTGVTHFLYGRRAADDGDPERAAGDFARAVELSPGNDRFRSHWILALQQAGRGEDAGREARRALEDLPDSALIRLAAARLETAAGRASEAFGIFHEVFQRWPSQDEALAGMLEIDFERARSAIERAYQADPSRPGMRHAMARVAELEKDLDRARKLYRDERADADRIGDRDRMLRANRALDRLENQPRLSPGPDEAGD